tara:strand:- start:1320 stop:1610 length:291 start_codon:yes stop_codon:yes gene_type:complete
MTKEEIRELIQQLIHEYMNIGVHEQLGDMSSTGLTSDDGNNAVSQRDPGGSFTTDSEEIEFYNNKGAPYGGAEGQHTRGMEKSNMGNPNRTRYTRY